MRPSVVSASKSGAVSPICRAIVPPAEVRKVFVSPFRLSGGERRAGLLSNLMAPSRLALLLAVLVGVAGSWIGAAHAGSPASGTTVLGGHGAFVNTSAVQAEDSRRRRRKK